MCWPEEQGQYARFGKSSVKRCFLVMNTQNSNHFTTQYKRSLAKQKAVTAPIMRVSRDFRRRVAVNTLLTCNKTTARIKTKHIISMLLNRQNTNTGSNRGYSSADCTNFGGCISKGRPLLPQGGVCLLSMLDYRINLHRQAVTSPISTSASQNSAQRSGTNFS